MDESPLVKLTQSATAAHLAIQAARDAARRVSEQAALQLPQLPPVQGQAGSNAQ